MPRPIALLIALVLLAGTTPLSAETPWQRLRSASAAALGERQQAWFLQRLADTAERIERRERSHILSRGQAAFMQQDLLRVERGIGLILARSPSLTPDEVRSYRAMLDRVDLRLLRADARRMRIGY